MTLKEHIIFGGAASLALYPFAGIDALWFFGASVFIDIDHYFDFIYHNRLKDLSIMRMFSYHKILGQWLKRPDFLNLEVFHTLEFLSLILALALILRSGAMRAVFFGLCFHIALDVIFLMRHGVLRKRVHSIAGYFIKKRSMARRGLDPARLYKRAVELSSGGPGMKTFKGPIDHHPGN